MSYHVCTACFHKEVCRFSEGFVRLNNLIKENCDALSTAVGKVLDRPTKNLYASIEVMPVCKYYVPDECYEKT